MTGLAPAAILWLLTLTGIAAAYSPLPRRPEPGVSEHGTVRVPGEEPREVGLP